MKRCRCGEIIPPEFVLCADCTRLRGWKVIQKRPAEAPRLIGYQQLEQLQEERLSNIRGRLDLEWKEA